MVLSTLVASTKLTIWHKKVDVITSNVVLGQVNDRHCQTLFTMMVAGLLRDVASELGNLSNVNVSPCNLRFINLTCTLISLLSFRLKQDHMTFR